VSYRQPPTASELFGDESRPKLLSKATSDFDERCSDHDDTNTVHALLFAANWV
jgi:hypothetical protein